MNHVMYVGVGMLSLGILMGMGIASHVVPTSMQRTVIPSTKPQLPIVP